MVEYFAGMSLRLTNFFENCIKTFYFFLILCSQLSSYFRATKSLPESVRARSTIIKNEKRQSRKTLTFSTVEQLEYEKTGENVAESSDDEEKPTTSRSFD